MPISVSHIVEAMSSLGGTAHLDQIVARVGEIAPKPLPIDIGASVRARIQERCKEAASYKPGAPDLFASVHGVTARKGVWQLKSDTLSPRNPDGVQDGIEAFIETEEGRAALRIHLRHERSKSLIKSFKDRLTSLACAACGFDFERFFGELGSGYIEVHHTIPVASLDEGSKTKLTDLVALCANCHRMIHRNGLITLDQLKAIVAENGH